MKNPILLTYYNASGLPLEHIAELPYTHVNLAFILVDESNPTTPKLDGAIASGTPGQLTDNVKKAIKTLQSKGKKVLISFGGASMGSAVYKQIAGKENELAVNLAKFVKDNKLNGIDIDWEDTAAFQGNAGYDGVAFLVNLTKALRKHLPNTTYFLTHAPQPPYLEKGSGMDGYIQVMKQAGKDIDWLNVQFYNNPPWSGSPDTIVKSYLEYCKLPNLSWEKLLVGLPVTQRDAGSGYIPVDDIVNKIIKPLQKAKKMGGMMNWQYSSDIDYVWADKIGSALGLIKEK
ncbi:MAG: glycosyl hydrolase family 18 protein [Hyphomicrobiales bacterium]